MLDSILRCGICAAEPFHEDASIVHHTRRDGRIYDESEKSRKAISFIEQNIESIKGSVENNKLKLKQFREENKSIDVSLEIEGIIKKIQTLDSALGEIDIEIAKAEEIYTSNNPAFLNLINEKTLIKPDSIYGVSKYIGEMFVNQELKKTKTKTTILRVFNTYGPGEDLNFLKKAININGVTHLVVNKMDVLEKVKSWSLYKNGEKINCNSSSEFKDLLYQDVKSDMLRDVYFSGHKDKI